MMKSEIYNHIYIYEKESRLFNVIICSSIEIKIKQNKYIIKNEPAIIEFYLE